jgi:hypothetical protein
VINILLKETSSAADNLDRFTQTYWNCCKASSSVKHCLAAADQEPPQ